MHGDHAKAESIRGLFCYSFQLVFCHFTMRVVIDSLDLAAVFHWPHYPVEINNRTNANDIAFLRAERGFCHGNFTNDICHAFTLLVTVNDSKLSSH